MFYTANELKAHKKLVAVAITIIVIFASSLFIYNYIIDSVKLTKEDAIAQAQLERYDYIWGYLNTLIETSESHAAIVSNTIEREIADNFDLDKLYTDLESGNIDVYNELKQIFIDNIKNEYYSGIDNHRNAMMVLAGDGTIIEDYTVDSTYIEDKSVFENQSFLRYESIALNKRLLRDAYEKIKSHSSGIIAIEIYDSTSNPDHILINEVTYTSLKEVYVNEGLAGFKNYQFLVPIYITDTGDIFGQQDIVEGKPQDTYKFIVIQSVSLYDQLLSINAGVEDTSYLDPIETRYDNIVDQLHLLGIVICVAVVLCILYIMSLYNVIADERDRENNIPEDDDNT